jgi:hypothetical protein
MASADHDPPYSLLAQSVTSAGEEKARFSFSRLRGKVPGGRMGDRNAI